MHGLLVFRERMLAAVIILLPLIGYLSAQAAPIAPGGAMFTPGEPDPIGGIVIGGGIPVPFASPPGPGQFSGTLTTTVIAGDGTNPFGGLTFTFVLHNDATSLTSIERMTNVDYGGFLTDVSYQVPTVGQVSTSTDRSFGPGSVVGWFFTGAPLGLGRLAPGATSALLVVQTNAMDWTPGSANIIDGSVQSAASLGPAPLIPEPGAVALLACLGLGLRRRVR